MSQKRPLPLLGKVFLGLERSFRWAKSILCFDSTSFSALMAGWLAFSLSFSFSFSLSFFHSFLSFSLSVCLKCSGFTRLWSFLLCTKVIQLHMHTHPFSYRFFSHMVIRILGRVPSVRQQVPAGQSSHTSQCAYGNPKPPGHCSACPLLVPLVTKRMLFAATWMDLETTY